MLVYIPQLTKRKEKLREMRAKLPKERIEEQYGRQSNIIDYTYTNYDLAEVEADYHHYFSWLNLRRGNVGGCFARVFYDL